MKMFLKTPFFVVGAAILYTAIFFGVIGVLMCEFFNITDKRFVEFEKVYNDEDE